MWIERSDSKDLKYRLGKLSARASVRDSLLKILEILGLVMWMRMGMTSPCKYCHRVLWQDSWWTDGRFATDSSTDPELKEAFGSAYDQRFQIRELNAATPASIATKLTNADVDNFEIVSKDEETTGKNTATLFEEPQLLNPSQDYTPSENSFKSSTSTIGGYDIPNVVRDAPKPAPATRRSETPEVPKPPTQPPTPGPSNSNIPPQPEDPLSQLNHLGTIIASLFPDPEIKSRMEEFIRNTMESSKQAFRNGEVGDGFDRVKENLENLLREFGVQNWKDIKLDDFIQWVTYWILGFRFLMLMDIFTDRSWCF
jgi:hypothetical protein